MWTTTEINIKKPASDKGSGAMFTEGIEGFPMKIMATTDMMGTEMTTITTVTEVKKRKVPEEDVSVPEGYEVKETTFKEMFGPMGGGDQ